MANPTTLKWSAPAVNVDSSPFTAAQYAGFELEVRGPASTTVVAVPVQWQDNREYSFPLKDLGVGYGRSALRMRTVAVGGLFSDWSNPVEVVLLAPPSPPFNVRVE